VHSDLVINIYKSKICQYIKQNNSLYYAVMIINSHTRAHAMSACIVIFLQSINPNSDFIPQTRASALLNSPAFARRGQIFSPAKKSGAVNLITNYELRITKKKSGKSSNHTNQGSNNYRIIYNPKII